MENSINIYVRSSANFSIPRRACKSQRMNGFRVADEHEDMENSINIYVRSSANFSIPRRACKSQRMNGFRVADEHTFCLHWPWTTNFQLTFTT